MRNNKPPAMRVVLICWEDIGGMKKNNRWFGVNISYKVKLTLVLLIYLAFPVLIIGVTLAVTSVRRLDNMVEEKLEETIELYQKRFELKRGEFIEKMNFLTGYSRLNDLLRVKTSVELMQMLDWDSEINEVLDSMITLTGKTRLMIYSANENLYDAKYIRKLDKEGMKKYDTMLAEDSIRWRLYQEGGEPYLNSVRKYSLGKEGDVIIDMIMPMGEIFALSALEENNCFTVYVQGEEIIPIYLTQKDQLELAEQHIQTGRLPFYKVKEYLLPGLDGVFYTILDTHSVRQVSASVLAGSFLAFVLLGIVAVVVVRVTVDRLTRRLTQIVSDVTCDDIRAAEKREDDEEEFNIIQTRLYELVCDLREQNDKMLKMELENLSGRLSPHFLYNNLSSIKYKSNSEEMNQVVDYLVSYYRYMFSNNYSFCPLGRDAENLKAYTRVLAFSYDEEFDFICSVPEELAETQIPSNILQPLVENAFLYGVNNKGGNKHIRLEAYTQEKKLIIEISDDGGGVFVEKPHKESSTVLINKRLKLYYGEEYGLSHESRDGLTIARIRMPGIGNTERHG